jgi:glycerate 2-kinase
MTWSQAVDGVVGRVLEAVLESADPAEAVRQHWPVELLSGSGPLALLAFGKGSVPMARASMDRVRRAGRVIDHGLVIAVPGEYERASDLQGVMGVEVLAGDHPLPTERNLVAANRVEELAQGLDESWTVVCLISGGGSAHLASPREGLTLAELTSMTDALLRAGATIQELNTVRKHLERLKGGQLAQKFHPARVISLVLSDVLRDPLDVISSGPTAPDPSTFAQAIRVLDRHQLDAAAARTVLEKGLTGQEPETPKPGDACFAGVRHRIIANNRTAVDAACDRLRVEGYEVVRRDDSVEGEAAHLGRQAGLDALRLGSGQAIVAGGESTVMVGEASGVGGRNQELALAAAIELDGSTGMLVASFGTDGRDGPTDAAGAVADGQSVELARAGGVKAETALRDHNSHAFFSACDGLIRTGPTGTNVNDVWLTIRQ